MTTPSVREALAELVRAIDANTGAEPSVSAYEKALDDARRALTAPDPVLPEVPETVNMRDALTAIMRAADKAKEPCGMDPESPAAIRNGKFATIAAMAAQGLGIVRGPSLATPPPAAQASAETVRELAKDEEAWYLAVRKAEHMCPTYLPHLDKQRWKARHIRAALTAALAQKETPRIEGVN